MCYKKYDQRLSLLYFILACIACESSPQTQSQLQDGEPSNRQRIDMLSRTTSDMHMIFEYDRM